MCCPTSQLCGGKLLPDPPDAREGEAAMDYAEFKLQLLDFSQVAWPAWRVACSTGDQPTCQLLLPPITALPAHPPPGHFPPLLLLLLPGAGSGHDG